MLVAEGRVGKDMSLSGHHWTTNGIVPEALLTPIFPLENLQIDLVFKPLELGFCNCLDMLFFPFEKKWQNILKKFCFLVGCFIHIAMHQKIIEYVFYFETTFENSP